MHCLAGVRGYLKMLAVVIAKFKSLDSKKAIVSGGKKLACLRDSSIVKESF